MFKHLLTRRAKSPFSAALRARLRVEQLETRLVPYGASANTWPHPELVTLSFVPDGTQVASNGISNLINTFDNHPVTAIQTGWRNEILRAAQSWAEKTNLNFSLVSDDGSSIGSGAYQQGDPAMGDLRIGGYHMGATAVLGQAYAPPPVNNYSVAGDIQLNMSRNWNVGTTYDLYTVALHEIGHSLGIYHANGTAGGSSAAVMWSSYQGTKAGPNADDTNGARNKYSNNLVRAVDAYDAVLGNGSFLAATVLDSLLNSSDLTALVTDLDLSTSTDVDYYTVVAPLNTSGTLTVNVQSAGLSLLSPQVTVYAADMTTVLGSASAAGDYDGAALSVTIEGVTPLEPFFIKVSGAETGTGSWQAFNTGKYGLTLNFGSNAAPTIPLPYTSVANGNPLSSGGGQAYQYNSEFRVNTTTANTQALYYESRSPNAVAMDSKGEYVVTWASSSQDGSGYGVYAQRYKKGGNADGPEFRVNTTTASDQLFANVAKDADGNFVIVWSTRDQDGSGWGVYGRRYNAAGVAQGGEFQINTVTASDQKFPTLAMAPNGSFVVTWSSGSTMDVKARRYDANGVAQGNEFLVNTFTSGSQNYSTAAMDANGNFVITWTSSSQDGSGTGVYAQRFNAAGVAQGSEFRVNATTSSDQKFPSVAMDAAGNFAITWSSNSQDGSGYGIYARRYDAAGVALGGEFRVNTATADDQIWSTVAMDGNGNFLITWTSSDQDGPDDGIYAQQYSSAGATMGEEFRVNTTTTGDQRYSSVALNTDGDMIVVWSGNGPGDSSGVSGQMYRVNSGNGMSNMEAGADPYDDVEHDHDHDHAGAEEGHPSPVADWHFVGETSQRRKDLPPLFSSQTDNEDFERASEDDSALAQHASTAPFTEDADAASAWRGATDTCFADLGWSAELPVECVAVE